jgi:acetyltransferase-like isoleucine patch superfamily enzyme
MLIYKIRKKIRALMFNALHAAHFSSCGLNFKLFGSEFIKFGYSMRVGDNCWIEAVGKYMGKVYSPKINFGDNISLSDNVHISSALNIVIGDGVLIGSRVYIGDHSHGTTINVDLTIPPGERDLLDQDSIFIGKNCWICDGVVVLAGTNLYDGCIVAANSVVKIQVDRPCLLAGSPAKIIRNL